MAFNSEIQSRFIGADFITPEPLTIIVGGCGGTGSHITFLLSALGHEVHVFDNDKFEIHNVGGQMVTLKQLNIPKVSAIKDTVATFFGDSNNINSYNELYTEESMYGPYMFACFDQMKARAIMFDRWLKFVSECPDEPALFVDIRMDAEQYDLYIVTKDKIDEYKKTLYSDETAIEPICTLKQTKHIAFMATGHAISLFTNFIANTFKEAYREVVFKTSVYGPLQHIEQFNEIITNPVIQESDEPISSAF